MSAPAPLRVLVAASSLADARTALRLVEHIDDAHVAELGGLFLEDAFLADLAGVPGRHVVTPGGGLAAMPSPERLIRLFDSDAAAFRDLIGAAARHRKWSFERRRGEVIACLCAAAAGWDMALVGHSLPRHDPGQVVVIAPPAGGGARALNLAAGLAQRRGRAARALALSADAAIPPGMSAERFDNAEALLTRLARLPASVLVVDLAAGPFHDHDQLRRLQAAARCPIVLLGAQG